jgi:hypothetical protein
MTPKDKAEELVDKFYQTTPNESWINEPLGIAEPYGSWKQAKECALIAVNEIKKSAPLKPLNPLGAYPYWQEVKQEIEKL